MSFGFGTAVTRAPLLVGGGAVTYATWNPADKGASQVLSNGDLTVTSSSGALWEAVRATIGKSTGKWQFQVTIDAPSGPNVNIVIGVGKAAATVASYVGSDADAWGYFGANGMKVNGAAQTAYGGQFSQNDVITCYYDADTGTLGYILNGVDQGTIATGFTGEVFPMVSVYSNSLVCTTTFGATALTQVKAGYNTRWASA